MRWVNYKETYFQLDHVTHFEVVPTISRHSQSSVDDFGVRVHLMSKKSFLLPFSCNTKEDGEALIWRIVTGAYDESEGVKPNVESAS